MGALEFVLVVTVALLILFAIGQPVAFAMTVVGLLGMFVLVGPPTLSAVGNIIYHSLSNPVLVSLPLFVFMGELLVNTGLSKDLYKALTPWLGRLPGGLLHSNIGACAVFAAISGSSPATAATIGTVAIPELEKRNYDSQLILGSIAGGGTLGILIPPSITMIIYASMVGESIGQLFIGGIFPGIMLAGLFMVYILVRVVLNPRLAPDVIRPTWRETFSVTLRIIPTILLIGAVLGTIYLGVATATEASAIGVAVSFILGVVYRTLNWHSFKTAMMSTMLTTCSIMVIFVGASFIAAALARAGVPIRMAEFVTHLEVPALVILLIIYVIYLILGCFFDPMSIMVLTLPILFPTIKALGYDTIWFGIVLVMLIEAGMLTPPGGAKSLCDAEHCPPVPLQRHR
ncbi:MAG: TRAP transporter large permease subunit [Chloroflexota bacterium]